MLTSPSLLRRLFCGSVVGVQFIRTSASLSLAAISLSRAALCELLAIRVFRESSERTVQLSTILLTPWDGSSLTPLP
jgi:c-di-GMP-related signal transduction protein